MMSMKLKFAFGKIRETDDFLDALVIDAERTEIRNGVGIRRLGLNRFEIDYEDETVTVDLNLAAQEDYETPYPLGYHNIKRQYFSVIHAGEGDGWDINRP